MRFFGLMAYMKKLAGWISLLSAVLVFSVSFTLLRRVARIGVTSPWFTLAMMFYFLGIVGMARPLFLLRLPAWLRPLRAWEKRGKLYQRCGVPVFGVLLRRTPLRYLQPLVYLQKPSKDYVALFAQIEGAEAAHLWAAVLVVPYMVYACIQGRWGVLLCFLALQIIGNLYPIWHLRWVRCRLEFVSKKQRQIHRAHAPNTMPTATAP